MVALYFHSSIRLLGVVLNYAQGYPYVTDVGWSRDSVVGIATSYRPDDREVGVRVLVGSRIFSSPNRPDRLCGPPNLLSNGYRSSFPRGKAAGA
jgi:hypothetical protein